MIGLRGIAGGDFGAGAGAVEFLSPLSVIMGDCDDDDASLPNVPVRGGRLGGFRPRGDCDDDASLPKVPCRGGGAGGFRSSWLDRRISGCCIQSGSASVVNGFEERWPFGTRPSPGGLMVAFTGTPNGDVSQCLRTLTASPESPRKKKQ